MKICEIFTESDDITIKHASTFKSKDSALDYGGINFDTYHIYFHGKRIGELTIQKNKSEIIVRNILLYDDHSTGNGIGKTVYKMLNSLFPGKRLRSSYNINNSNGQITTGLSKQAILMWDSLVSKGLAVKHSVEHRFYYEMK